MRISLNWLREFVDIAVDAATLGERLSLVGLSVDEIERDGDDFLLDLDITTNRGDCLSHLGVAREVATIFGNQTRLPETGVAEGKQSAESVFSISIADADLCRRYCGRYIAGVRIGKSPDWLARRVEAVGIRSINNVADITNYVLMELGHPLHAFDADTLSDNQIVVRRAQPNEDITTLDGQERSLAPSMLVIADGRSPVALAGVIGGQDTEISGTTRNVLLESAWFDPLPIRRTARALNLSTEASYRFERGADIKMARTACDRAARLIQEIAGGTVYAGLIDVFPSQIPPVTVHLRRQRIAGYLGMDVAGTEVERIFAALGFEVSATPDGWALGVPSHRHDVSREEDLLEEVARIHGYDRFPSTLPGWRGKGERLPWQNEETRVRKLLGGMGYSEACNIAFSDPLTEERFSPGVETVAIRNPLSEEAPILRASLVPGILRSLEWNLNRGARNALLYEIAKVYPKSGEYRELVLAQTGAAQPDSIHRSAVESGFFSLKGHVEALLENFPVGTEVESTGLPGYYQPGRSVRIGTVARLGELDGSVAELFKLRQKVYVAEIALEELYSAGLTTVVAAPIPKYPAIRRDLSLLVQDSIRYADILSAIRGAAIEELVAVNPFDRLENGPFPEGFYSLAVGLTYQSSQRTLTDAEVETFEREVLNQLKSLGAERRS